MDEELLFTADLFGNSFPINYEKEADQWLGNLQQYIVKFATGIAGYGMTTQQASRLFPYPHWEYTPNGVDGQGASLPKLKMVPVTGADGSKGLYFFAASNTALIEEQLEILRKAITGAKEDLSKENPKFQWAAIIGQVNSFGVSIALGRRSSISNLKLRSGGGQHFSSQSSPTVSLYGSSFSISFPIVVEGVSSGYNWLVATRQASQEVNKIAALLSVAWGTTIKLLHSPQLSEPDKLKLPLVGNGGLQPVSMPKAKGFRAKRRTVPSWVEQAYLGLPSDSRLDNALNAHYQGLLMEATHPSFAMIAFVASIEVLGRTIIGDKCSCCGKWTGNKERFTTGLRAVVKSQSEVKRLAEAYSSRSDTAHEGVLHANETSLGSIVFPSMFSSDAKDLFAYTDLRQIKDANRALLMLALKGRLKRVL